jgi:acetyl esterase/lipase
MKKIFSFLIMPFFIFACKKIDGEPPVYLPATPAKTILNVAYGTDAYQIMDVYLPENRTADTKIIIAIHGGGWVLGDKADVTNILDSLRKRLPNYAFININYRLSNAPVNLYPIPNNDVTSAINFVLGKKAEYMISDKMILFGISAGGHLALYESYKNNNTGNIKAVVSAFGIPDLTDMWNNPAGSPNFSRPALTNYLGTNPIVNASIYAQASPITYVTAQSVPTQLFHGTADTLVRYQQSVALKNKLQTLSVPVQYTEYIGEGHGWVGPPLSDTYSKITLFVKQYLP